MSRYQFCARILCIVATFSLQAVAAETVAIVNVKAYTITQDNPLENATILIVGNRIADVGSEVSVPEGARIIDGRGYVATPGFMNSASHLGLTEVSSVDSTSDYSVNEGPLGASFDVQYALNANSELVAEARTDGLARAISIPERTAVSPFAGLGALLHLKSGPSVLQKAGIGLFVEIGGESSANSGGSRSAQWLVLRHSLDEAATYRPNRRSPSPRDSSFSRYDLEVLREVLDGERPLVIGTHRESDIRQAIKLAKDYKISIIIKGGIEAWLVAEELASASIPVVVDPSINLPLYFDRLYVRADSAAILDRAGVLISFMVSSIHTSFDAGFTLREVAGIATSNGLDYQSALKALTINAARTWRISDHYGSLEAGMDADVVVWDGDPFEPATSPQIVFVQGEQISMQTRRTSLRDRFHPLREKLP